MDVRCERCKTEYELDDARVTEAGVPVRCTTCNHVFTVKKAAGAEALGAPLPPPPPEKREWRLRQTGGGIVAFKELTTLQKWIVERKAKREDEISAGGETWRRLGDIGELAPFFQIVDEADRAAKLEASLKEREPVALTGAMQKLPAEPVAAPVRPAPPRAEEAGGRGRRGGGAGWLVALLLVLALGGAAYVGYFHYLLPQQVELRRIDAERRRIERELARLRAPVEIPPPVIVDAGAPEQGLPDAGLAAATPQQDAGLSAPDAGAAAQAGGKTPERPLRAARNFDSYMELGDRLRNAERPEEALEAYEQAATLKPDRAEPYAGRGLALLDLGRPSLAEVAFQQALKLNPRYGVALMGLAETYKLEGKKAEAVQYYERYLDVLPNGPEAPVARAAIKRLKE